MLENHFLPAHDKIFRKVLQVRISSICLGDTLLIDIFSLTLFQHFRLKNLCTCQIDFFLLSLYIYFTTVQNIGKIDIVIAISLGDQTKKSCKFTCHQNENIIMDNVRKSLLSVQIIYREKSHKSELTVNVTEKALWQEINLIFESSFVLGP